MQVVRLPRTGDRISLSAFTRSGVAGMALGVALLTACGSSAGDASSQPTVPTTTTTLAPTRDPLDQCTDQLEYWAGEMLADFDDPGWDYQHMGLTATKYDVLRAIVKAARTAEASGSLAPTWVHDEVLAACTEILAAPPTSDAPGWP